MGCRSGALAVSVFESLVGQDHVVSVLKAAASDAARSPPGR